MQTLHGIAGIDRRRRARALLRDARLCRASPTSSSRARGARARSAFLWELHVVPGHGIAGHSRRRSCCCWSPCCSLRHCRSFSSALETIATAIVLTVIAVLARGPRGSRKRVGASLGAGGGARARLRYQRRFQRAARPYRDRAHRFLRPAGIASIDGRRVDVLDRGRVHRRRHPDPRRARRRRTHFRRTR